MNVEVCHQKPLPLLTPKGDGRPRRATWKRSPWPGHRPAALLPGWVHLRLCCRHDGLILEMFCRPVCSNGVMSVVCCWVDSSKLSTFWALSNSTKKGTVAMVGPIISVMPSTGAPRPEMLIPKETCRELAMSPATMAHTARISVDSVMLEALSWDK